MCNLLKDFSRQVSFKLYHNKKVFECDMFILLNGGFLQTEILYYFNMNSYIVLKC